MSVAAEGLPALTEKIQAGAEKVGQATEASTDQAGYNALQLQIESNRSLLMHSLIIAAVVSLVVVLGFVTYIGPKGPDSLVTASGLVLVIYSTMIVVVFARSSEQLTAPIGVLGAIAGYLFGKATKGSNNSGGST